MPGISNSSPKAQVVLGLVSILLFMGREELLQRLVTLPPGRGAPALRSSRAPLVEGAGWPPLVKYRRPRLGEPVPLGVQPRQGLPVAALVAPAGSGHLRGWKTRGAAGSTRRVL